MNATATTPAATVRAVLAGHRDLRLLLAAGLISMTGDWVLSVGLVYTVYAVTGSTLASAGALMAAFLPQVLTGLVAGVFVDRWSRAGTMVVGNLLLAVGILPLLLVDGRPQIWIVYAVLAATAVAEVFVATADSAMLPLLVTEEAPRLTANALNGQVGQVARLVGGSVGGVVAATGGLGAVVVVDGLTFLVAALLVRLIRTSTRSAAAAAAATEGNGLEDRDPGESTARGALRRAAAEWREGATTVRRSRVLRVLVVFSLITAVGEGIMGTLFTPFVKDVLEGNAATLGVISSAQAVGGILGGFVAAAAGRRWKPRVLFGWGSVIFGLVDLAIFVYPVALVVVWPAVLGMVVVGFPAAAMMAAHTTLLQQHSTDDQRGRIFSLLFAVTSASLVVGATCAGFLGESIGIIPILALQGGGYVLAGAVVLVLLAGTDDEVPDEMTDEVPTSAAGLAVGAQAESMSPAGSGSGSLPGSASSFDGVTSGSSPVGVGGSES